jgi:hypothetical protein
MVSRTAGKGRRGVHGALEGEAEGAVPGSRRSKFRLKIVHPAKPFPGCIFVFIGQFIGRFLVFIGRKLFQGGNLLQHMRLQDWDKLADKLLKSFRIVKQGEGSFPSCRVFYAARFPTLLFPHL